MAEGHDAEDKTEEASERRIEQALERGDVPRSADLQGFVTLTAGLLATVLAINALGLGLLERLAGMLAVGLAP